MKRKSSTHDHYYSPSELKKKRKRNNAKERPKRTSALKANEILSSQLFVPRLEGDDLPELDLSFIEQISSSLTTNHHYIDNSEKEHFDTQHDDEPLEFQSKKQRRTKHLNHVTTSTTNNPDNHLELLYQKQVSVLTKEMLRIENQDISLIEIFKNIEREYEERIKMLTEKCFLLECKLSLFNEERREIENSVVELDPIYEFGGLSPPSSPVIDCPVIELTPPSPPPRNNEEENHDASSSQETQIVEDHYDAAATPQKRRVGVLSEDPMEMHINSSPSLSDTTSEIDFSWLFEQHLMPPPSTPSSSGNKSISTPSSSTSSASDLSDHSSGRRSTRRGEKRQKIESILNRMRTEMSVSILLPNLILNEYVSNEIERSESLSLEKTPPKNRNLVKRASEQIYTDRRLKLKDKSYVRTNYSYRGIELPENLIFFCKL